MGLNAYIWKTFEKQTNKKKTINLKKQLIAENN